MNRLLVLLWVLLLWPSSALAGSQLTSSLSWIRLPGADSCIAPPALARAVEARLGRVVFVSPSQAQLSIEGRIAPAKRGPGWRAVLTLSNAAGKVVGRRSLRTKQRACSTLNEALALVVGLLIDPDGSARAPVSQPVSPRVIIKKETVIKRVVLRQPWHLAARAAATMALGPLPKPAPGVMLSLHIDPPGVWPLQLEGGLLWGGSAEAAGYPDRGLHAKLAHGALSLCPSLVSRRRWALGLCAGTQLGALLTESYGWDLDRDQTDLVLAITAQGTLTVQLAGPLHAVLHCGAAAALIRPRLTASRSVALTGGDGDDLLLFQPDIIWFRARLGIGVRFF